MGQQYKFWHESVRMFLRYMAVGAAFVPSALIYAFAFVNGWDHWLVATFLLGIGFVTAHIVWTRVDSRFRQQHI